MPPTNVAAPGRSESASHTQSGPSTISSSVISATSPAGISRPPIVRNTKPRPIWQMPSVASSETSSVPTCAKPANGAASTKDEKLREACRRGHRHVAVVARQHDHAGERHGHEEREAGPSALAPPGPPTMIATPASATPIAIHVRRDTRSPSIVPSAAAMIGASACMKSTFATGAWFSAMKNDADGREERDDAGATTADRAEGAPGTATLGECDVGEQAERREERASGELSPRRRPKARAGGARRSTRRRRRGRRTRALAEFLLRDPSTAQFAVLDLSGSVWPASAVHFDRFAVLGAVRPARASRRAARASRLRALPSSAASVRGARAEPARAPA